MKTAMCSKLLCAVAVIVTLALMPKGIQGQTETVLLSMGTTPYVYYPQGLVSDGQGNFYSATSSGAGALSRFSDASGEWQGKAIHLFDGGNAGSGPTNSIVFDGAGNLYGTTIIGGKSTACPVNGCEGSVYMLSPQTDGTWKLSLIHVFTGLADGGGPSALVFDGEGNLYGMTVGGGNTSGICASGGCGTVFRLSPKSGGGWTFRTIHTFSGKDGVEPQGNLLVDAAGNLYGSTVYGGDPITCTKWGPGGCGVVFRLAPNAAGGYTLSLVHRFLNGPDGAMQGGSNLVFDGLGNLYGVNLYHVGDPFPAGVFMLTPTASVPWTFTSLYKLTSDADGHGIGALTIDGAGTLYGATELGGDPACSCGTVFELSPGAGGWSFNLLHTFMGLPADGFYPTGLLLNSGDLFGTTFQGGKVNSGTLFEITP